MAIGYLLGGLACLAYFVLVTVFGGIMKTPWIIKIVKLKLKKDMSDKAAALICIIFGGVIGAVGVFLLVFGAMQS